MHRLEKIGKINAKKSNQINFSKIGIGFEKLDRKMFDPEKVYDRVADLGVKKVRIQSGWARTEKEKGIYDFAWLDSIVDNFLSRGIEPWMCLCYGNALYSKHSEHVFGMVGVPPIFTDEEKTAWINYVKAVANRYKGKITYYEVWNEPDGKWCWKHGANAEELGIFTKDTAIAVKEVDKNAKIIGGSLALRKLSFLNTALKQGMADVIDYISFHEYTHDETNVFEKVESFKALLKMHNPNIGIIQGESGSQSREGGKGALRRGAWSQEIQAKQLARHTIADLLTDVHFTSYFTAVDMPEALNGDINDKTSYLDYGYFGVLGADFDEDGHPIGEYTPKLSYYVLQNICSIFSEEVKPCTIPSFIIPDPTMRKFDTQPARRELITGGFEREGGKAFVYWKPTNIMTTSFNSSITLEIISEFEEMALVDVMDGNIYKLPEELIQDCGDGVIKITELPVKDTPLMLVFGKFIQD